VADADDAGATGGDAAAGARRTARSFNSDFISSDINLMRSLLFGAQNVRVDQGAWAACVCVKLHLRDELTNELRDGQRNASLSVRLSVRPFVYSFVCLFVRCVCQRRPSYGGTNRDTS